MIVGTTLLQMISARPFRFGVQASTADDAHAWVRFARQVESLGYSTLTMPDHFGDQLAPVPALMAAAAVTTTLRVGGLVWDNDYKHPVVLAKELATMDVLSGGRLEIGLGAGWLATDYQQSGIPYDSNKVRVDRFEEGLAVIKGAMRGEPFSFAGQHYTITDYAGAPRPVQAPCPPILVGGGGPRVLSIAAREADIVGINGNLAAGAIGPDAIASMTAAAVDQKIATVAAAAGSRLAEIEFNVRAFMVRVTDERQAARQQIADFVQVDPTMVSESPFVLIGTPAQMVDDLLQRRERWGFNYVIVGGEDVESFAPVVAELAGK
ncbi:MAG TPA: TIGR03621 family F420-dependent LLM class oxidoreductase [Ilumatobacteraceae bacterium]|nr:TIGR03621 family F420-dependent LLM class oxidoreductase [Ilumatobacteraceae bacterium]